MSGSDPRLWWLAGEDAADLARQLDRPGAGPDDPPEVERGPARLGIADPDDRKLRLARRLLAEGGAWRGRSDIWYSPTGLARGGGKIAFLFPGVEPTFGVDAMDLPGLAARFDLVAPLLEDDTIAHRSASIYRVGIFLDQVMRRLGIAPDLIAGHSIGEWSGSVAAGIIPIAHASDLLDVIDPSTIEFPDLDFAAFAAGVDAVAAVVDRLDDIVVSHDNSPGQSIVCGTPAMVDEAVARLRERNVLGYKLGFQSGFHTPAMTESLPTFRAHLDAMEIGPGHIPMWSATSVAPYPRAQAEIIDLHLRHLEEPVRFRPLVERLYHDAGVRVFVQVGVGSLTGFVADTLGDLDHASVAVLTPRRSALAQVSRVLTALWVEGLDADTGMLQDPETSGPGAAALPPANGRPAANPTPARPRSPRVPPPATPVPAAPIPVPVPAAPLPVPASTAPIPESLAAAADMLTAAARASQDVLDALVLRLSPATVPAARRAGAPPASTVRTIAPPLSPATATATGVPADGADRSPPPPAPPPSIPAWAPAPALDWPTEPTTVRRLLSLETMPETIDHTLYEAPEGWPDVSDRFPIVAMTTQLQLLEDIAASYAGGRDVIELFGVRNYRWLDISDPIDLEITVTPKGDDVLGIALGPYCRANVRVGRFPPAPRYDDPPLVRPRPTAHTAQEMFDLRLMFHGPLFQGIPAMGPVGDDGMLGTFDNLATPGSLLDNLGKLIAYWAIDYDGVGEAALPSGVGRVELFGPKPAPGVEVRCDIRVIEQQRDLIRADGVLVLPDGSILARVQGWTSILFHLDELMEPLHHAPGRFDVAEAQPGGWYVVRERWPTGPARDLTARRYLARDDRARYERMNLLEQRRWLLDVIAAKDAVRHWLRDTFGILCFPVEVALVPDGDRHFRVTCGRVPEGHDPRVTLSSFNWVAVAVVGDGEFRDIEAVPVDEAGDVATAAHRAADSVAARNPGAEVHWVEERQNDVPSRLEVPDPPPFAVAWT
jgi:malonyl CoA-acyl carrier protein transacylase